MLCFIRFLQLVYRIVREISGIVWKIYGKFMEISRSFPRKFLQISPKILGNFLETSMGFPGNSAVLDVHIEAAYAHTGGMPVGIQQFCYAQRRHTVRLFSDNTLEYREDPMWFTPFYRRDTIE